MPKFTPGPWTVDDENQICAGNFVIGRAEWLPQDRGQEDANAKLIGAAPDLLESCQALLMYIALGLIGRNASRPNDPALVAARAAIAKATK